MNLRIPTLILAAAMVASSLSIPAESSSKKKAAAPSGASVPMSTMAPLTTSECERLGGDVNIVGPDVCKGGKACTTDTLNNGIHTVCITEAN
jgi:hypothetical protein